MDRHGDQFPENPQNIDELIDTLAERSAAAQRMLASMSRATSRIDGAIKPGLRLTRTYRSVESVDANLQNLRPDAD